MAITKLTECLIVWLAQIPFLYMHPNNLRYLFIAKSIIVPICFIAMLIWAFRSTGGTGGPLLSSTAKANVGGSAYSYAWLSSLTSVSHALYFLDVLKTMLKTVRSLATSAPCQ